jgi:hypothetical protein
MIFYASISWKHAIAYLLCAVFAFQSSSSMNVKELQLSKAFSKPWKAIATISASAMLSSSFINQPAFAFGPADVPISVLNYKQVELCDGRKPIMPGQKAAEGLFPVCIEVEAEVTNAEKNALTNVGVYGFVKENNAGNSVLPNNPDFRSDSGQYAMIKTIPPGKSIQTYQFVAAVVADPKKEPIPPLTFDKTKARAYPGGDKFRALDVCEVDPRADGCGGEEED